MHLQHGAAGQRTSCREIRADARSDGDVGQRVRTRVLMGAACIALACGSSVALMVYREGRRQRRLRRMRLEVAMGVRALAHSGGAAMPS